jgi:O-antigen/teichoic acid export membrane protein
MRCERRSKGSRRVNRFLILSAAPRGVRPAGAPKIKPGHLSSGVADPEDQVALSGTASEGAAARGPPGRPGLVSGLVSSLLGRRSNAGAEASRHAAVKRVAGAAFLIRVASAGIMYVSQVLLARWMGRFEFGIYVYVWAWVGFLGMLTPLGVAYSAQRFIPEYRTRGDLGGLRGFLTGSRILCFVFGVGAAIAMAGIVLALGQRISAYFVLPFLLASLTLPIFTVSAMQDSTARSFDWIDIALVPGFIIHPVTVLTATSTLYFLGSPVTAALVLAVACMGFWAVVLVQFILLNRRLTESVEPGARRYEPLHWLRTALPLFIVDGFFLMLTYVDTLVLQVFVGPADVAVYYAATKTLALVNFIYYAVSAACAHRFSEYHVGGETEKLRQFLADAIRWTFWPSLALAVVLLVLGKPILTMFGPGFAEGYPLICIMTVGLLARSAVGPAERLLNMLGQQKICAAIYGCAFAVNLALCIALVPRFGLFGAASATATAVVVESILLFVVAKRRLGLHVFVWGGRA